MNYIEIEVDRNEDFSEILVCDEGMSRDAGGMSCLKVRFIIRTTDNRSFAGMIDVESLMEHLKKVKAKSKRKNKS